MQTVNNAKMIYWIFTKYLSTGKYVYGFPGGSEVKASACNAGDLGSIPGSGRSPGEGNGNPLQYSCLENPMDGGVWWATVHGVTKSRTRLNEWLKRLKYVYISSLEKEMATHSSILAWEIPRTEEPSGLQSTGWQRSPTWLSKWTTIIIYMLYIYI